MDPTTLKDLAVVKAQLRRDPRGRFDVCVRCSFGYPQVIRVAPVIDRKPFPTLYWLTCPFLRTRIGSLEADGWIKRLEGRMAEDPCLQGAMQSAHRRTIRQRDLLLTDETTGHVPSDEAQGDLARRGIGGISDWTRLKCLHLHVAHAMADRNPVGEIVLQLLRAHECSSEQVICSAYV